MHDYINSYRIEALKQMVQSGQIQTVNDCILVGFGTPKTARCCFERSEDMTLDDFLAQNVKKEVEKSQKEGGET